MAGSAAQLTLIALSPGDAEAADVAAGALRSSVSFPRACPRMDETPLGSSPTPSAQRKMSSGALWLHAPFPAVATMTLVAYVASVIGLMAPFGATTAGTGPAVMFESVLLGHAPVVSLFAA